MGWKGFNQKMAKTRRIAGNLDSDLRVLAGDVVASGALIVKEHIDKNISPPGGLSLAALREAGYPLSSTGFRPSAAGLDKEYQIIEQSGGLRRALGIDGLRRQTNMVRTFVGFDDSGTHRSESGTGFPRSVDMNRLLNWLINGTSTLVGRPVLINSLGDAIPDLKNMLEAMGLRRRSRGGSSVPRARVVK